MKNILFICLVFIPGCKSGENQEVKDTNVSPVVGTWEYTDNQEGIAIFTETHFVWVIKSQADTLGTFAAGGTYSFSDSLFTWNTTYSTFPDQAGTSLQTVSTFEGDMTYFKILDSGFEGSAKRIAR